MERSTFSIEDIAREAGVSKATVSRVLNNNPKVQAAYRERVEAVVRRYNYRPNKLAQSLRNGIGYYGPTFHQRSRENTEAKIAIARKAAEFVRSHMTIFLDAGSTTQELAYFLRDFDSLTVITNSLAAHSILLNTSHRIILAGGIYHRELAGTIGSLTTMTFESAQADVSFLSASKASPRSGLQCYLEETCQTKLVMAQHAKTAIALLDSSKFGPSSLRFKIPLHEIDHIVTDHKIRPTYLDKIATQVATIVVSF